ncbi:unnamed protein product [Caenorhabditis auriculariae]|uniref:PDZ domain-containing protein n=1 Tax=Caenorhabditis auriculariae TaxID=2777116 RepID=A0A8S1GSB1_9PELO|nr:unnamed protein product [Caenorhabditis auriculariae]
MLSGARPQAPPSYHHYQKHHKNQVQHQHQAQNQQQYHQHHHQMGGGFLNHQNLPPKPPPNLTTTKDYVTPHSDVRVLRLECASDGGVLDFDDRLEDVFDSVFDQILAIYDEGNGPVGGSSSSVPENHYAQPMPVSRRTSRDVGSHDSAHPSTSSLYGSTSMIPSHYASSSIHRSFAHDPMSSRAAELEGPPSDLRVHTTQVSHDRGGREWRSEEPRENGGHPRASRQVAMTKSYTAGASTTTTAHLTGGTGVSHHRHGLPKQNSVPSSNASVAGTSTASLGADGQPVRSSLRSQASTANHSTTPSRYRVTMSPDVEKKLTKSEEQTDGPKLKRGSDRKSRINDAFLDARERLAEDLALNEAGQRHRGDSMTSSSASGSGRRRGGSKSTRVRAPLREGENGTTVLTLVHDEEEDADFNEGAYRPIGIEVNAVFDDASSSNGTSQAKLTAVQVMKIEENGRAAKDGRLLVGDNIVEIDGRPVYQMSILRARAYISDLSTRKSPTLTIARPLELFGNEENGEMEGEAGASKPIFSALQQANTQYIGHTTIVELIKSPNGFGFTVTGRETAKGERLFYIGTVKPYGIALGHLKSGDRLLEINGESTANMTQQNVVDKLKEAMVGQKVKFLVSRVSPATSSKSEPTSSENKENEDKSEAPIYATIAKFADGGDLRNDRLSVEPSRNVNGKNLSPSSLSPSDVNEPIILDWVVPLNDSGSAGLGVSLKARVSVKSDQTRRDCGIFIKNVMHGGAVFKDGRIRVNDRIVGIEGVNLEGMTNAEASRAISNQLKAIGDRGKFVHLRIQREPNPAGTLTRDTSRITVDAPSPSPSSHISHSLLPSPASQAFGSRAMSSSGVDSSHSRQSSANSNEERAYRESVASDLRLDDSDMPPPSSDPFDREAPTRKSLSEKRGLGAAADPQHIRLFQDIKHQRQSSAPPGSSTPGTPSGHARSVSQRAASRYNRSASAQRSLPPYTASERHVGIDAESLTVPKNGSQLVNRRSLSMESINRTAGSALQVNNKRVVIDAPGDRKFDNANPQHPFPPGSPIMRLKEGDRNSRDKQRRKSVGVAMKNFFGFGGKSREASPEKPMEKRREESASRRPAPPNKHDIMSMSMPPASNPSRHPPPPPSLVQARRRGSESVYVDYGDPYGIHQASGNYDAYDTELYDRYAAHRYGGDRDAAARAVGPTSPPSYINFGMPTSHSYHGGSFSSAVYRRPATYDYDFGPAVPANYEDSFGYYDTVGDYSHIPRAGPAPGPRRPGTAAPDYYHMFNSWFACSSGGGIGAAPAVKAAYGAVPPSGSSGDSSASSLGPQLQSQQRRRGPSPSAPPQHGTAGRGGRIYAQRDSKDSSKGSSRLLVFPTTRFVFASHFPVNTSQSKQNQPFAQQNTSERLSLRARKKRRAAVRSEIITNSQQNEPLHVEMPPTPTELLLPKSTSLLMSPHGQQLYETTSAMSTPTMMRSKSISQHNPKNDQSRSTFYVDNDVTLDDVIEAEHEQNYGKLLKTWNTRTTSNFTSLPVRRLEKDRGPIPAIPTNPTYVQRL